jgi:hypothetical protein
MKKKKFKYETYQLNDGSGIPIEDYADATFVNFGTATININGFPLAPNQSFTDPAFGDEKNASDYRLTQVNAGTFIIFMRVKIYLS